MKYFIDFEATQFSNDIISIGCVRENGDEFYYLVNPKKKITPFITDLTGITDEMLQAAPTAEEVFNRFFDWCAEVGDDLPIFYCYGNSDIYFVKKNFNKSQSFKAKNILAYMFSDLYDYEPTVRKHFGLIQAVSLIKVASYYKQEELVQTHNALADAKMLKFVHDQIQKHSTLEDKDAFPEYQQVAAKTVQEDGDDWSRYKVFRIRKGKTVETYNSLGAAVEWVFNQLPDNGEKDRVVKRNLANKIKNASNKEIKYLNYKWKVVKK